MLPDSIRVYSFNRPQMSKNILNLMHKNAEFRIANQIREKNISYINIILCELQILLKKRPLFSKIK